MAETTTPAERTADRVIESILAHLPQACRVGCAAVGACRQGLVEGYALQDARNFDGANRQLDAAHNSLQALTRVTKSAGCTEPSDGRCTNPIVVAAQNAM